MISINETAYATFILLLWMCSDEGEAAFGFLLHLIKQLREIQPVQNRPQTSLESFM